MSARFPLSLRLFFTTCLCLCVCLAAGCSGKQVHVTVENEFNMMAKRLAPVLKAHGVIDEHGAYVAPVFSTPELVAGIAENVRFAWRPLETSHRLQDQINQFTLFVESPSFTPSFLTEFLVNYRRHADHILHNYSKEGNHLLFEAQRMLYAGAFFPEFKEATTWRKSGIDILNREIKKQYLE